MNTALIAAQVRYSVEAGLLLLGVCVLIGPLLAERFRIPGIVGLIAAGTLLGPHAFSWLQPGGFVATLGAAGLLYLMFVAGLELDLQGFAAHRTAAVVFGALTFAVPFALSWIVGHYVLGLGVSATALIGAMWASHTLVAYPEVKAAGVDRRHAVGVSLAATVITDVLALIVLAVATSSSALDDAPEVASRLASGTLETTTAVPLWAGLLLLVLVCFVLIPRTTRWLFARVLHRRTERFVWTLVAMSIGAIAGLLGGIEGMVGAFLAGIGMNASVPARSELMERIEFIGSALLIPAFLISVGLSIDPVALADPSTLAIAGVFTATVLVGKAIAAIGAGLMCSFERSEIAVMTSLTIGQAAATLAIAEVGVSSGLLTEAIRNAAVVTVLATALVTSIGTRVAARRLGDIGEDAVNRIGDHVLVLAPANVGDAGSYGSLASALVRDDGGLVTPFVVRTDRGGRRNGIADTSDRLGTINDALVRLGHDTRPIHRVADSVPNGIAQLADEVDATLLLAATDRDRVLELLVADGEVDRIVAGTTVPVAAVSLVDAPWRRVVLVTPLVDVDPDGDNDIDHRLAAVIASKLAAPRSAVLARVQPRHRLRGLRDGNCDPTPSMLDQLASQLRPGDLLVAPHRYLTDESADRTRIAALLASISLVVVSGGRQTVTSAPSLTSVDAMATSVWARPSRPIATQIAS